MTPPLARVLADIVGPEHCLSGTERSRYVVDGRVPCAVVFPGTAAEVGRVVLAAREAGVAIMPWGSGTKMGLGAPPRDGLLVVGTRRLNRVIEHEPGDLTATVEAGATVAAVQAALGGRGQWLSLDPPFPQRATLGGVLATNAAGPRRHLYGTARDLVLGMRVVGADGETVKAGGKVVKNVAGYDLAKLHIGALGTLGLIVEVTVKLRPVPEADLGCRAVFRGLADAGRAVAQVLASDLMPHTVELLDAVAALACAQATGLSSPEGPTLVVGFDGLPRTVAWQLDEAERVLARAGAVAVGRLDAARAAGVLAFTRDLAAAVPEPLAVARAVLVPSHVAAYAEDARALVEQASARVLTAAHAGCGIVRLVVWSSEGSGPGASATAKVLQALRERARTLGGHLVIEAAPLAVKGELAVWDDPGPAARLMQRIKGQVDPAGMLNPGRFVNGI